MTDSMFFKAADGLTVSEIASLTEGKLRPGASGQAAARPITGIAALDRAGPGDATFFDNVRYAADLTHSRAGLCFASARLVDRIPERIVTVEVRDPYRAFVTLSRALFPDALRPSSMYEAGAAPSLAGSIHPSARLEADVWVEPGAIVGADAEIGAGSRIAAGAVVGPGVRIGRDCAIGANATISHALIGDRVVIHPGVHIGQDGFGYVMGAAHLKVPQIGRVIIQNDVEIGAGTTIDRGANRDTIIGEGSKIDNLVQIGHNVTIGRHCVIVAQTGISGSVTLQDFVVLGARVGINNHVTVGEGAQIAATSTIKDDVPPRARWGGSPAKPAKLWFREIIALERLARGDNAGAADQDKKRSGEEGHSDG